MKKYGALTSGADIALRSMEERAAAKRKETTSSAAIQDHFARKFGLIKPKRSLPSAALRAAGQAVVEEGPRMSGKDAEAFLARQEAKEALHLEEKKYSYLHKLTLA